MRHCYRIIPDVAVAVLPQLQEKLACNTGCERVWAAGNAPEVGTAPPPKRPQVCHPGYGQNVGPISEKSILLQIYHSQQRFFMIH
jgi:hypothetical protein